MGYLCSISPRLCGYGWNIGYILKEYVNGSRDVESLFGGGVVAVGPIQQ